MIESSDVGTDPYQDTLGGEILYVDWWSGGRKQTFIIWQFCQQRWSPLELSPA